MEKATTDVTIQMALPRQPGGMWANFRDTPPGPCSPGMKLRDGKNEYLCATTQWQAETVCVDDSPRLDALEKRVDEISQRHSADLVIAILLLCGLIAVLLYRKARKQDV